MHGVSPSSFGEARQNSVAGQFAKLLHAFYRDLIEEGVPEHLAALVRRVARSESGEDRRRLALVVEADPHVRSLAVALLEETDLRVMDFAGAEEAIAALGDEGVDLAFVFTDEFLPGAIDGIALAGIVKQMQPAARVVITSEDRISSTLPDGVVELRKPWRSIELLRQAGQAERAAPA